MRHGESEANAGDFINDDPARPVNLTLRGRRQAEAAAERLRSIPFTHAFASAFPRAQQTARIILAHHRCVLRIDARLNERRSGLDGLPTGAFNDLVRPDPVHIKPPLGETFLEQTQRVGDYLDSLGALGPEAVVLAVSHEHPIRSAIAVTGCAPEAAVRHVVPNCGAVTLEFGANGWLLVPQLQE